VYAEVYARTGLEQCGLGASGRDAPLIKPADWGIAVDEPVRDVPLPPDWKRRRGEVVRKNEAMFRAHNERRMVHEQPRSSEHVPLVCECGDAECWDALQLTFAEFEGAHATPHTYAVKPLHVMPDFEVVLAQRDRYWVVEKYAADGAAREAVFGRLTRAS